MVSLAQVTQRKQMVRREGDFITTSIENVTNRIPSGAFLAAGLAVIGIAAGLQLAGKRNTAQFLGLWVPALLVFGVYNKLVKLHQEA